MATVDVKEGAVVTRWVLFGAICIGLWCAAAIGAVAVLAYDGGYYAELRTFLGGAGCPAPCFMGIRPAGTGVNEAYEHLRAHPWVEEAIFWDIRLQFSIEWRWNGRQPPYLRDRPQVEIRNRAEIEYIAVPTTLTVGELWLALGAPESMTVGLISGLVHYPRYGFFGRVGTACRQFWRAPVKLYYAPTQPSGEIADLGQMWARACQYRR